MGLLVEFVLGIFLMFVGALMFFFSKKTFSKERDPYYDNKDIQNKIQKMIDELETTEYDEGMTESGNSLSIPCRTCGYTASPEMYFDDRYNECPNLAEVHPHKFTDSPPDDNPYTNLWFQCHGYDPNFPNKNDIDGMKSAGVRYWMDHENWAWDSGYRQAPEWYIRYKLLKIKGVKV